MSETTEVKKAPAKGRAKTKKAKLLTNVKFGKVWHTTGSVLDLSEEDYESFAKAGVIAKDDE